MTMSADEAWLANLHPQAKAHMVKEVSKVKGVSRMVTKCGKDMRQTQRNVGTIWHTRVTCEDCINVMNPTIEEVASDEDLEW